MKRRMVISPLRWMLTTLSLSLRVVIIVLVICVLALAALTEVLHGLDLPG